MVLQTAGVILCEVRSLKLGVECLRLLLIPSAKSVQTSYYVKKVRHLHVQLYLGINADLQQSIRYSTRLLLTKRQS